MVQLKLRKTTARSTHRAVIVFSMIGSMTSMLSADEPVASPRPSFAIQTQWAEALQQTIHGGQPSVILVTSQSLPLSRKWAAELAEALEKTYGPQIHVGELVAESDPKRVESLNVKSIPTALVYAKQGNGQLQLVGYRENQATVADLKSLVVTGLQPIQQSQVARTATQTNSRPIRVHRVSNTVPAENSSPATATEPPQNQPAMAQTSRDEQIQPTTHHPFAQSSPQNPNVGLPSKQMPPGPSQSPPTQSPPTQPVYSPPQPQPVYAYVPQQQPVYAAPPTQPPVTVQPPAGQVVVQSAPLNVMVAPPPPPQVTYMAHPTPTPYSAPTPNAFMAPPFQPNYAPPAQPNYAPPVQPNYAPPVQPNYAQPLAGAPLQQGGGGLSYGFMMTSPGLFDRFIGGLGRVMAERGNPRIRLSRESPEIMRFPAGMAGTQESPLQTYMAVPDEKGDATEAYIKAYLKLCKEKGITPTLPGMEPPPDFPPTTGPVPSPQDTHARKKWWFH